MRSTTHKTTVTIQFEVEVEFKAYPGCRGARDSLCGVAGAGPPLEPDDPPEVEVLKASVNGTPIELSEEQIEEITAELFDSVADDYASAMEDKAERQSEINAEYEEERRNAERGLPR